MMTPNDQSNTATTATWHAPSAAERAKLLQGNLTAIGERNQDVREKIAATTCQDHLALSPSSDQCPSGTYQGRPLGSRHHPEQEGHRLTESIDLVENAVVVVYGFGLGYHVKSLAKRMGRAGIIVVYEPDTALLRSVFEQIDHSSWLKDSLVVFFTDPEDRGVIAAKLDGTESVLAQGMSFVEHPASRQRLKDTVATFSQTMREYVSAARVTLTTTLIRSADTVHNLLLNIDHYSGGARINELAGCCADYPAVVVSAGPSLHRNIERLKQDGVRDRCVIIAVQTTLQPLLDAGITPHFVTALDYHEISKRFYERLDPEQVQHTTLVCDPKAHPVILDAYPGPIRCIASSFLEKLMGPTARNHAAVPTGATVAHLAVYLADFLGCNPIALIGQDLGFTDGLYYAPGTSIHDVWAPELNPFNTIAMMEWQRIVRHRQHLETLEDHDGKSIFIDAQMRAYLKQFERDFFQFRQRGVRIIDASEGGTKKQHAEIMPLQEVLNAHATRDLPALPFPQRTLDIARLNETTQRLKDVRADVRTLGHLARQTTTLVQHMLRDQDDPASMKKHFVRMEKNRAEVESRLETLDLLNLVNQLGVYKRLKADRRVQMQESLDARTKQRAHLERDLENVRWIADAAEELLSQLDQATRVLDGEKITNKQQDAPRKSTSLEDTATTENVRLGAAIVVDGHDADVACHTITRLLMSRQLDDIVLLHHDELTIDTSMFNDSRLSVMQVDQPLFGDDHRIIKAARRWSSHCWRGGIGGMSIYDEYLAPEPMCRLMQSRNWDGLLVVGADWPALDVIGEDGCDTVLKRFRDHASAVDFTISQAPPGLCGCVIGQELMQRLAHPSRRATLGANLVYQPSLPQPDPVAKDFTVQINHRVRGSLERFVADTPERTRVLCNFAKQQPECNALDVVSNCNEQIDTLPTELIVELTTTRTSHGVFAAHPCGSISRDPMSPDTMARILNQWPTSKPLTITFDGVGDPLCHPSFLDFVQMCREHPDCVIHMRTELRLHESSEQRLLDADIDVLSVDLHADRAKTYEIMMGDTSFKDVLMTMERFANNRPNMNTVAGKPSGRLPWIVPRIQRRLETYEDINSFYDRWQHILGAAVIESPTNWNDESFQDTLTPAVTPKHVGRALLRRRMTICCDGTVPVDERDLAANKHVGNVNDNTLDALWSSLVNARGQTEVGQYRP